VRLGEAIIDLLAREYGLRTVFGIPGVHNIELYRGLHASGVRAISPRHEQGAGFMADGWSVVTGTPGVCTLISGPGLTNALTPIAQAFHDSRPMLVLAATTPTEALGRRFGPLHDLDDQAAVARTVTAFSETVLHPDEVPELIAMAYEVFSSQRPRPVHLAFPTDVLELETGPLHRFESRSSRPVPVASAIEHAVTVLQASTSPLVVAGGGAIDAGAGLRSMAELLDAPVVLTGNAKGVLASSHPLCVGNALVVPAVQAALEAADVVLVVGSELSDADLYNGGRALEFAGSVVRIDIDHEQIERRLEPEVRIVADAELALRAIADGLSPATRGGAARAEALRQASEASHSPAMVPWLDALQAAIPGDAIVALDSTQLAYAAHVRLPAEQPRSWLAPYGLGTLGCALPMAIGAKLAAPHRPVVALAGDGGWLFTVAEMATAVDEALDLVLVVWDNRGYAQIRQSFDDADAPRMGVDVSSVNPDGIATGFGWTARTVHDPAGLTDAVRVALAEGGPQFVRVMVPPA